MKNLIQTITMVAILMPSIAISRNYSSVGSGNFTSSSTWQNGYTPAGDDTLTIEAGHTVTVSSNLNYTSQNAMFIIVKGSFYFNGGGSKIRMATGSIVDIRTGGTVSGNGSGSSQTIVAGGSTLWSPSDGTVSGPASLGGAPLPVSLILFEVNSDKNGSVKIEWATASEHNSEWFVVEKSLDGNFFTELVKIYAAGNSNELNRYATEDQIESGNMAYYRLVQYDFDGKSEIFATKMAGNHTLNSQVSVWPNPSSGSLNMSGLNIGTMIQIYDISGKLCHTQNVLSANASADMTSFLAGFYTIYTITASGTPTSHKWVIFH